LGTVAVTDPAVSEHRLAVSTERLRAEPQAAELLVHALAQLPDHVTLELPPEFPERVAVERLARAYGIDNRVSFGPGRGDEPLLQRLIDGEATFAEVVEQLAGDETATFSPRGDDTLLEGERVAVVTNLPAHYRVPLLNAIASRLDTADARFRVLFSARTARSRPWLQGSDTLEFEHEFLRTVALPSRSRPPVVPLDLDGALRRFRPTILLSAGFSPVVSGRVARYARQAGVVFGIWSGEHGQMKTARDRLRLAQRRRLLARADFAIAYGSAAVRYLRVLAPTLPTVIGRNTAPLPDPSQGSPNGRRVEMIVIGDLADHRKGIDVAINAVCVRPELDCHVKVIGGGAKFATLKSRTAGDRRIEFLGARSPEQTRLELKGADAFLFPTRSDVFGLALVEAMGAGLCALVSRAAGSVDDLCVHRRNCLLVADHDPQHWADALAELVSSQVLRTSLAASARRTILRRWTVAHAADAMVAGLRLGVLTRARH
jgi:hypothetical protein